MGINIHAVDDNPLHRQILEGALSEMPRLAISWSDGFSPFSLDPDLIIVNLNHGQICAKHLLATIATSNPDVVMIGYAIPGSIRREDFDYLPQERFCILDNGDLLAHLTGCLELFLHSGRLESGEASSVEPLGLSPRFLLKRLSPKERDVFCLVAKGYGAIEIAELVGCGSRTVETHLKRIRDKLRCGNMVEMRNLAWQRSVSSNCKVFSQQADHRCPHIQDTVGKCPFW